MALSIKDPEADRLARAVAKKTGETITRAVVNALRDRLAKEEAKSSDIETVVEDALAIGRRCASLRRLDDRSDEEILGYDENGIPR